MPDLPNHPRIDRRAHDGDARRFLPNSSIISDKDHNSLIPLPCFSVFAVDCSNLNIMRSASSFAIVLVPMPNIATAIMPSAVMIFTVLVSLGWY